MIEANPNRYVYFRFDESGFYTQRIHEKEALITHKGMDFFRRVYQANQGRFLFADTLLWHRESTMDFAQSVLRQLAEKKVTVIQAEENMKIHLRQAYFIDFL